MPSSGVPTLDKVLGGEGYPEKSAVLITGPPGIGKEALCYWFAQSALENDEFCLYVTRLSMKEVLEDERAFSIPPSEKSPLWLARDGGQMKLEVSDLSSLIALIKRLLDDNSGKKIRIVLDILSSLLMMNSSEATYMFVDQLMGELKRHDAVLLATLEDGMHPVQTQVAMQQLFDGFIEFSFHKSGLKIIPLLKVGKMRGLIPRQTLYTFNFEPAGLQLSQMSISEPQSESALPRSTETEESIDKVPSPIVNFSDKGIAQVFDYLVKVFIEDYLTNRLAIEQAGWRTRLAVAEATGLTRISFYGKEGKFGPVFKELLSSGLVEARFFSGQRGRGGEVTKIRIAFEKEVVKRIVERTMDEKKVGGITL